MDCFSETSHSTSEEQIVRVCVYTSAHVCACDPPMSNNHPHTYHPFLSSNKNGVKRKEKSSTVEVLYEILL